MNMFVKSMACLVLVCTCSAGEKTTERATQSLTLQSMTPQAMKTAYVYLVWYVDNLHKNNLTEAQKKQLDKLKMQVDATFAQSAESSVIDTQQLWQKLAELEQALAVIADTMKAAPPPALFRGDSPMSSTQISVSPSRKRVREKMENEEDEIPGLRGMKEPILVVPSAVGSSEFDPNED